MRVAYEVKSALQQANYKLLKALLEKAGYEVPELLEQIANLLFPHPLLYCLMPWDDDEEATIGTVSFQYPEQLPTISVEQLVQTHSSGPAVTEEFLLFATDDITLGKDRSTLFRVAHLGSRFRLNGVDSCLCIELSPGRKALVARDLKEPWVALVDACFCRVNKKGTSDAGTPVLVLPEYVYGGKNTEILIHPITKEDSLKP